MDSILGKMCQAMQNIPKKTGSGFVYVFSHPTNGAVYKIGKTQDPKPCERDHRNTCKLISWELR